MKSLLLGLSLFFTASLTFAQVGTETEPERADVPFAVIEKVPVYPGCTGEDNKQLKKCMSEKIQVFVTENFNLELANTLKLRKGRHRMAVQFKIDKKGMVTDITARAPHIALEEEAIRVVNALPTMRAGIHRGEEVNVLYALPIIFEVEGPKRAEKQKRIKGN
jgi:hypothetical protein